MISTQVCLGLVTIKGHSKMYCFITQHNATDVASFEEACNWHAQGQGPDPGEDDALDWRVRQHVPIAANIQQLRTACNFRTATEREFILQATINSMQKRCVALHEANGSHTRY